MAKSDKIRSKFPAMITYIVAVVVMLAGLLLPLGTKALFEGNFNFKNMPVLQLTSAVDALLRPFGYRLKFSFGAALTDSFSYGLSIFGINLDIGAILFLVYTAITVIALGMIIPICLLNRQKDSPRKIAVITELVALSVLLVMALLEGAKNTVTSDWNLGVLIPLAVLFIVLAVQSIIYYGGSGVIKTVTVIISALAVVVVIWNIGVIIPPLASPIGWLVGLMQGGRPFATAAGLYSLDGYSYVGTDLIYMLVTDASSLILAGNIGHTIINFVALALVAVVCVNLFLNVLGLGKSTNRFMVWANLVRYVLEFLLIAALIGSVFWMMGNFGLLLYVLTALTLAQLIIAISRLTLYGKKYPSERKVKRKAEAAAAETAVAVAPVAAAPVVAAPVTEKTIVYRVNTIYNGPSDEFINKLSTEEKVEFARVFLERSTGRLSGVPDYVVGGNNAKFFSSIFVYLARVRDHVSDALMNKLYQEVNLLA